MITSPTVLAISSIYPTIMVEIIALKLLHSPSILTFIELFIVDIITNAFSSSLLILSTTAKFMPFSILQPVVLILCHAKLLVGLFDHLL